MSDLKALGFGPLQIKRMSEPSRRRILRDQIHAVGISVMPDGSLYFIKPQPKPKRWGPPPPPPHL